jgi:hypothetical protein
MNQTNRIYILALAVLLTGCAASKSSIKPKKNLLRMIDTSFINASVQYRLMMKNLPADRFPKTYIAHNDEFRTAPSGDWCSGFYPGTLFYLYEQTKDTLLLQEAERKLNVLEKEKNNRSTHDLGFMMYCSFGNGQRLTPKSRYEQVLLTSARSLAARFDARVGCIKSWDRVKSWDGKTVWAYPVIIDNMMNLELLFYASRVTGDTTYRHMAISHAYKTMQNHVRPDFSSYHVVNYDPQTGAVKSRETHQGFSDNSTWARGQAWGIYGFTMLYRKSKEKSFLKTAVGMADYFLAHLPKDTIPAWDFNVNQKGFNPQWNYDAKKYPAVPKDASAAAVTASALIELSGYVNSRLSKKYLSAAETLLYALSSAKYTAAAGSNGNFILKHSTGSFPANSEIDVLLTYADYYYVEAMKRYKELNR